MSATLILIISPDSGPERSGGGSDIPQKKQPLKPGAALVFSEPD